MKILTIVVALLVHERFFTTNALSDPLIDYKSSSIEANILKNEGSTGNTLDIDLAAYPNTVTIENNTDIGLCNDICFAIDKTCIQVDYDIGKQVHPSITIELYAYQITIAPDSDNGGTALCQWDRCIIMHDTRYAPSNSTSGFGMYTTYHDHHISTGPAAAHAIEGHESLTNGEWHHIIAIWDGLTGEETLYVDDDAPITVPTLTQMSGISNYFCLNTHPLQLFDYIWHGCYRRVRIFDGSLYDEDIITLKQEYKNIQRASCKPLKENCETLGDIKHVNWNNIMMNVSDESKPTIKHSISVSDDLILSIDVELDYLGYSYGGMDNIYGYGTTYHLGFYLFDSLKNNIYQPSNCDNRLTESFINQSWYEHWVYSEYPYLKDEISTNEFLAYPPPSVYWKLSGLQGSCSTIKYTATFSWNDLMNCQSFDGLKSLINIDINNNNNSINMNGIFYVTMISPMNKIIDINTYYVYELLSYPFTISIPKSIYILQSIGISLFRATVISIGKKNNENIFEIIVLTESAEYISLKNPILLSTPNGNFVSLNNISQCVSVNSFICTQFWSFQSTNISCPYILNDEYGLQFTAVCNSDECAEYIDNHGNVVLLTYNLNFEDTMCNTQLHLFQFSVLNTFYDNNLYNNIISNNHLYKIGTDRVYVEIQINNINTGFNIMDIILANVWLCTTNPSIDLQIDENDIINTGCFSPNIDINGLYHIIVNYDEEFAENAQHHESVNIDSTIRFSFIVPNNVRREILYIQSQINILFLNGNVKRRFLLVEEANNKNQISHSISNIGVYSNNNINNYNKSDHYNFIFIVMILICIMLILLIIFVCIKKRKKKNNNHKVIQQHEEINICEFNATSNVEISATEILKHINLQDEVINHEGYVE